jgi:hypothetical protein
MNTHSAPAAIPARAILAQAVMPLATLALATLALASVPIAAQEPDRDQELRSGPTTGTALTKVQVYAPIGPHKGREFDAAAELGKRPGAFLFVKELTRETAPIIRTLDDLGSKHAIHGFQSFTVLMSGDRTAAEETVSRTSNALTMRNPMVVSLDGAEGPGNYALNRKCTVTLVLCKNGLVTSSLAFTDTGHKDIPTIEQAVAAISGKVPTTPAEWQAALPDDPTRLKELIAQLWLDRDRQDRQIQRLTDRVKQLGQRNRGGMGGDNRRMRPGQGQGQRPRGAGGRGDAQRRPMAGKKPDDPQLEALIRRLIRQDNKTADLDAIFADIDKRVGQDAGLQQQILAGLELVGSLEYGTDEARERAKAYRAKHHKAKKDL